MLDKMLEVAYRSEQTKTASRTLVDKLKEFPLDELQRYVDGDENCKLAYALAVDGAKMAGDSDFCWLDKYKGTPFFSKAVELEKQILQLDAEDQAQREAERAQRPAPSDIWARRDALALQKRMLDLDFIMAQNGGDPTSAAPAAPAGSPEELSTADAPELALEQGSPPKAPKGPPAGEAPPAAAGEPSEEELLAALEAEGGAPATPPQEKAPPKPKAPQAQESDEEEEEPAPPKKDEKATEKAAAKVLAGVKVGQLLAKTAGGEAKLKREIAKKHPELGKTAAEDPEGHHLRRFLLGNALSSAIEAKPGSRIDAFGEADGHLRAEAFKGLLKGGLGGAALGGAGGLALGLANKGEPLKALQYGATLGGMAGGLGGNVYGAFKGNHGEEASRIHGSRSKHKEPEEKVAGVASEGAAGAGIGALHGAAAGGLLGKTPSSMIGGTLIGAGLGGTLGALHAHHKAKKEKTAGFIGTALNAAKPMMSQLGNVANAGKSLATSAYAKGGLGQVASSFGNVAKNFAQKNPLAAAGIAGAGGLAAGKMLSNSRA